VYSGGDDVLAFLPLNTVVQCAKTLADAFAKQMRDFGIDPQPSLSVGIAICHHLEPLSDTLQLARSAEKIAKQFPGKNALAITLSKRGSGDRTISGAWAEHVDDNNRGFYDRLQKLTAWHREGVIPDSAAYNLHDLIERLGSTLPLPALKAEAVRIVKRKRGQRGQAAEAYAAFVALTETLPTNTETGQEWSIAQFANELIVTREFAKALGPTRANQQTEGVVV
jgi:CRISPR-associated protein Cmr2